MQRVMIASVHRPCMLLLILIFPPCLINHGSERQKTMGVKVAMILIQCVLGGITWLYTCALAFTHPLTTENLVVPVIVATACSVVSSALWSYGTLLPISLPALGYSLAFWVWVVFVSISDFHIQGLFFWGGLAASMYISGLMGSWIARKLCENRTT